MQNSMLELTKPVSVYIFGLSIMETPFAKPAIPGAAYSDIGSFQPIAPGVARLEIGFVNVFAVGQPGEPWVLVDAGLPGTAFYIRRAAEERFGRGAEAIVLTHGHFDHSSGARALSDRWEASIYAHPMELPFLTGRSDYPPQDPTVGGAIAFLSRFFPHHGYDLGERLRALPEDQDVPGMPGWRWLHTPGHTPGHVSLFREEDGLLLAGDALATMDLDSWRTQLTHEQELSRPPTPFTPDWEAARASIEQLAGLEPQRIGAGHGPPLTGRGTARALRRFAREDFHPPGRGRYAGQPARADEEGVTYVPPPVPDPLPRRLGVGAATLGGLALGAALLRSD